MKALAVVLFLIPVSAGAEIVTMMTPQHIQDAIALGRTKKVAPGYEVPGTENAMFSTPFARVASKAREAFEKYEAFTPESASDVAVAPVLTVYAGPELVHGGRTALDVKAVVLLPSKSASREQSIHPIRSEEKRLAAVYSRKYRLTLHGTGMVAVFPLADFKDGSVIRIVYEDGTERGDPVSLKDVR